MFHAEDGVKASDLVKKRFSDVPETHWSYKAVQEMTGKKIVEGYPDGSFKPDQTLTRAEFSAMLYKAARIHLEDADSAQRTYSDMDTSAWYKPFAEAVKGYFVRNANPEETDLFVPDAPALREDVGAAIVRIKGWTNADASPLKDRFKDYQSVSAGAAKDLAVAVDRGIVSGYEDGTVRGKSALTRAEAAVILAKAFPEDPAASPNSSATQTEVDSKLEEKSELNAAIFQKPLYAIVDTLASEVGVSYKADNSNRSYNISPGTKVKHEITELTADYEGQIYFIDTDYPTSTIQSLDNKGGKASQAVTLDDSFKTELADPVTHIIKEYKPLQSSLAPVKLLLSPDNSDLRMAANWLVPEFFSFYSLTEKGKLLGYAHPRRKLSSHDFIVQLSDGDFVYSDVSNGTIHRTKKGEAESGWEVKVSLSGKQLSALVKEQALYVFDTGSKLLIKIDLNSKAVLTSFLIQSDEIKYAAAKDDRFYFSTGTSIYSSDLNGIVEPFIGTGQFVYNEARLGYSSLGSRGSSFNDTVDISSFTFDSSGNLIFFDDELRYIRRLRLVTNGINDQASAPVILPTGPKLEAPEAETLPVKADNYQDGEAAHMIVSMVADEEGSLYLTRPNTIQKWDIKSASFEDLEDALASPRFMYEDDKQTVNKAKDHRSENELYFDEHTNSLYRSGWSSDLQTATINEIRPDQLAVGYMAGREPLVQQDFVAFSGTGQIAVSDVRQKSLWLIGKDRKGQLLSPMEAGNHIRLSGGITAALWKGQKLYVLDSGHKTVTEAEVDGFKYRSRPADLKINGTIDAVCVYGDKFYVISGTTLYHIDTNGDILLKEDLSKLLKENIPVRKINMDSRGRLFVLDQKWTLQRVHFYGK